MAQKWFLVTHSDGFSIQDQQCGGGELLANLQDKQQAFNVLSLANNHDALVAALKALTNPDFQKAYRDGTAWATNAHVDATNLLAALTSAS